MTGTSSGAILTLLVATAVCAVHGQPRVTANPRGWQAAQQALLRPSLQSSYQDHHVQSKQIRIRESPPTAPALPSQPQAAASSSAAHSSSAAWGLGLLLFGFVLGWTLASQHAKTRLQLMEEALQRQSQALLAQQQRFPVEPADSNSAHKPESLQLLKAKPTAETDAEAETTVSEQETNTAAVCDAQTAESSAPAAPAASVSDTANSDTEDGEFVNVSPQPAGSHTAASSPAPHTDEVISSHNLALSTPVRQCMSQPASTPEGRGTPARDSELARATALTVLIHRELAQQQVPLEQRPLIAGNVLAALDLVQRDRQHAESTGVQVQSNVIQKVLADTAVDVLHVKKSKAQHAIEAAHLRSFKESLGDDAVAGLCVMLATALWYSWSNGFLNIHLGRCRSFTSLESMSLWRLHVIPQSLSILWCWSAAVWQLLFGGGLMLCVAWLVSSRGWASEAHASPMVKLFLGLGLACGAIGRWAISCTGGAAWIWLGLWESWVAIHLMAAWCMPQLMRRLKGPITSPGLQASQADQPWLSPVLFHVGLALVLPFGSGMLPFVLAAN